MTIEFDPIEYERQLEAAGVSKGQAQVHAQTLAQLVSNCVARPHDLALIRQEIHALEERMRIRLESLEQRVKLQFEALEMKLTDQINALDVKFTGQITQLRWMLGTVVAMNIAIVVRLFIP
jgi:hypothetical protein